MRIEALLDRVFQQDAINFALTNRVPRRALTRFMAWFSRIEQPVVRDLSLAVWQLFAGDLRLHEAKKTRFASVHDCFVRELREGARPIEHADDMAVCPCDAIVGEYGTIRGTQLIQAKGIGYTLDDLLLDPALAARYQNGAYATLRLTSAMYHRFHAPHDCVVESVIHVPGDAWNVNPITLRRVPKVFCLNERAIVETRLVGSSESITLVAVAAILVAGIHLEFVDTTFNLAYRGPRRLACRAMLRKGQEMGHFLHGSTIIALATPGLDLSRTLEAGRRIFVGQPLFRMPRTPRS